MINVHIATVCEDERVLIAAAMNQVVKDDLSWLKILLESVDVEDSHQLRRILYQV